MKHIQQHRAPFSWEYTYYEVPQGTTNAIECKQGEHAGKWFITLPELEQRSDAAPNLEGELYLVTHISPYMFKELIEEIPVFSLQNHLQELEYKVDELIETTHISLWYSSKGDIALTAINPNSQWNQEAIQLTQWIDSLYTIFDNYRASVTEETHQDINTFLNNLPIFTYEN